MADERLLVAVLSFAASLLLVLAWLRFAHRSPFTKELLAIPNERSFHSQPKTTGGGVAIVLPVLVFLLVSAARGVPWAGWLALACGGVGLLGLLDDLLNLPARLRLAVQAAGVCLIVWSAGGFGGVAGGLTAMGWLGGVLLIGLLVIGLLWFLNLYNFMDGIDGLAAGQACCYSLALALYPVGDFGWLSALVWVVFASNLAFLAFNWAPAKLFMGDVGSAFLGLLLGAMALQFAHLQAVPLVASLVLLSGFWFDASYTLCVRILTGQRFAEGHRSHLYQKLAARLGHGRTTAGYVLFNLLWLWPLAYLSAAATQAGEPGRLDGWAVSAWLWCILACLPLAAGCWRLQAGRPGSDTVNRLD